MVRVSKLKEPKTPKEIDLQKACWQMLQAWLIDYAPLSDWSYHVPNGMMIAGDRKVRARRMASLKAQGFKNGVSDIVIAYPVWESGAAIDYIIWPGAYFELKMPGRYPTQEQGEWAARMKEAGYFTALIRTEAEFKAQVHLFLSGQVPLV